MAQPTLLKRIIGPSMLASYTTGKDPFVRLVVKSFLNVLVQSLYGSTRDLKEMIRLGRSLWPKYVLPVHSTNLRATKESVCKMCPSVKSAGLSVESHSKEIVSFLDVQILPQMRKCLEASIYSLCADAPASSSRVVAANSHGELDSMPYLTTLHHPEERKEEQWEQEKEPRRRLGVRCSQKWSIQIIPTSNVPNGKDAVCFRQHCWAQQRPPVTRRPVGQLRNTTGQHRIRGFLWIIIAPSEYSRATR
jgi:hypothetical protein